MAKTLVYKLFGRGKLPSVIENYKKEEGLIYVDEGIQIAVIFENYKSSGRNFKHKIIKYSGAICLTKKKFYVTIYKNIAIALDWNDPRLSAVRFSVNIDVLKMKFEASIFDEKAEGKVEYRFNCDQPETVKEQINNFKNERISKR